jgi:hypothetical protein
MKYRVGLHSNISHLSNKHFKFNLAVTSGPQEDEVRNDDRTETNDNAAETNPGN